MIAGVCQKKGHRQSQIDKTFKVSTLAIIGQRLQFWISFSANFTQGKLNLKSVKELKEKEMVKYYVIV